MEPAQKERTIYRINNGVVEERTDVVVSEYALTVKIQEEELATIVCTPEHLEDMVVGFLASEGIVQQASQVNSLIISHLQGVAYVDVEIHDGFYRRFRSKRVVTSCCGMSRQGFVFVNDSLTAKNMQEVNVHLTSSQCFTLVDQMQNNSDLFHSTGGVHNASLCTPEETIVTRKDIGRHNALDKIYGYCLRNHVNLIGKILVFSGRISSEILAKASKIGCEIVISKSAPTDLALTMAEHLGITTVGFVRGNSLNVYTRPDRITDLMES